MPLPAAVTENVAVSPSYTLRSPESDVTEGRCWTVTAATRLVTAPARFVATSRYAPSCVSRISPRSSVGALGTAKGTPFRYQRYWIGSVPSTNDPRRSTSTPSTPARSDGCCTSTGGCITANVASSLETDPSADVTTARYTPALATVAGDTLRSRDVPPATAWSLKYHWTVTGSFPR